ncbi:MAG: right-handed parallel beta-helix repeat-containing protein [Candidatus Kapabacteria bacterium]|nr:right-handed parallel beta-helix repeat-containing protein [Candidatus Kapabacteria bacterium]
MISSTNPNLCLVSVLVLFISSLALSAFTLNVGPGQTYATIQSAIVQAQPGDTVLIHPGTYTTSTYIVEKNGTVEQPIVIAGVSQSSVIIDGPSSSMQFVDCSHINIENLTIRRQRGNALFFDDAGTIETPSRNITVRNILFEDMEGAPNVNTNFLKMAGVDDFFIIRCTFSRGPINSLGIDLVGCRNGYIIQCDMQGTMAGGIQAKGGSQSIDIFMCTFVDCGDRAINIGGSTGLPFFRPADATFEASNIYVFTNTFVGCRASIAFAGAVNSEVVNNTIVDPTAWPFRILQESVDASRFEPCGNNIVQNNIIVFRNSLNAHFNVGPNTAAETFTVSNNLWYNVDMPSRSNENIAPVIETSSVYGQDPLFTSKNTDLTISAVSPAVSKGLSTNAPPRDKRGKRYASPPSVGAYEGATPTSVTDDRGVVDQRITRCSTGFLVRLPHEAQQFTCALYDLRGKLIQRFVFEGGEHHVPANPWEFLVVE